MSPKSFAGAHTALVTPFLADGSVDWAGFEKNMNFQIAQGISGLLPTGTTGESPALVWEEHNQVIDGAIKTTADRCLLIAGTGSNSTNEAVQGSKHAARSGADALLLVDCYYNGPSTLELRREYHGVVAAACPDCTVIPYVIPGRSGTALSPEDLAILAAEHPNVTAVKEATGDTKRMAVTRSLVGDEFDILSGDDGVTLDIMLDDRIRAQGVISVMSNIVPGPVSQMVKAALEGNSDRATQIHSALEPLFGIVTVVSDDQRTMPDGSIRSVKDKFRNPLAIKALMNGLGMPAGPTRRPLGRMTPAALDVVRNTLRNVWDSSPWVLEPVADAYDVNIAQRIEDEGCWQGLTYADV